MAVAPVHGKGTRVLLDEKDASVFLREITVSASMEPGEITTFGFNDRAFIPGLKDGTFSFDGLFSAATSAASTGGDPDDIVNFLDDALGGSTKHVLTVDLQRSTGGRALLMNSDNTQYDISVPVDDVVSIAVDSQASQGYAGGRMLRPLSAITTTGSGSGILTAGTTAVGGTVGSGGVAHFHLTAHSTVTSLINKVQHSTSGSTWADLITFTNATHETFQRSTVSGTVKEYLRSTVSTFTGGAGKSATLAVAFSRKVAKT